MLRAASVVAASVVAGEAVAGEVAEVVARPEKERLEEGVGAEATVVGADEVERAGVGVAR